MCQSYDIQMCESSKPFEDTTYPNVWKEKTFWRYDLSECVKGANLLQIRLIRICKTSRPFEDTTYPNAQKQKTFWRYDLSEWAKGADLLKIRLIRMCESSKPSEDTTYPKAKETVISLVLVFQCPVQRIGSPQDELLKLFYSNSKHKSLKHKSKAAGSQFWALHSQ